MNSADEKRRAEQMGIVNLVEDIFATQANELYCDDVNELMVLCAEELLDDNLASQRYPALFQHFHFCPDCRAEYKMLSQLGSMEQSHQLQRPAFVPAMPALSGFANEPWSQRAFSMLFPGFTPSLAGATLRGSAKLNFEPVVVHLGEQGEIEVELELQASSTFADLRTLYCTISFHEPLTTLDGARIWLETAGNASHWQEQSLDDLAEVIFEELPKAIYTLHLHLPERAFAIQSIEIP